MTIFTPRKPSCMAGPVQAGMSRSVPWAPGRSISWWWRTGVTMSPRKASARASIRAGKVRTRSISAEVTTRMAGSWKPSLRSLGLGGRKRCRQGRARRVLRAAGARSRSAAGASRAGLAAGLAVLALREPGRRAADHDAEHDGSEDHREEGKLRREFRRVLRERIERQGHRRAVRHREQHDQDGDRQKNQRLQKANHETPLTSITGRPRP